MFNEVYVLYTLSTWGMGCVAHIHRRQHRLRRSWSFSDGGPLSPRASFFGMPAQRPSSSAPQIADTWYPQCRSELFLVALAHTRHHPSMGQGCSPHRHLWCRCRQHIIYSPCAWLPNSPFSKWAHPFSAAAYSNHRRTVDQCCRQAWCLR